jgi:hypothetical protein
MQNSHFKRPPYYFQSCQKCLNEIYRLCSYTTICQRKYHESTLNGLNVNLTSNVHRVSRMAQGTQNPIGCGIQYCGSCIAEKYSKEDNSTNTKTALPPPSQTSGNLFTIPPTIILRSTSVRRYSFRFDLGEWVWVSSVSKLTC